MFTGMKIDVTGAKIELLFIDMKSILTIFALLLLSVPMSAQSKEDSQTKDTLEVKISLEELKHLQDEKSRLSEELSKEELSKKALKERDSINTIEIDRLKSENDSIKKNNESLLSDLSKAKKQLQDNNDTFRIITKNFLYTPYDDFSINEIAIPVYGYISDENLKSSLGAVKEILDNYKGNIKEVINFIKYFKDNLESSCFRQNIVINDFHSRGFYSTYTKYPDWKETYLGKYINTIDSLIKTTDDKNQKQKKPEIDAKLDKIEAELKACLETAEN